MISSTDICRAAHEMIRMFGEDAELRAAMRADQMLDEGDREGFTDWKQITSAIADLSRDKPTRDEHLH